MRKNSIKADFSEILFEKLIFIKKLGFKIINFSDKNKLKL